MRCIPPRPLSRVLLVALALVVFASACSGSSEVATGLSTGEPSVGPTEVETPSRFTTSGALEVRLSNGQRVASDLFVGAEVVEGEALEAAEIDALITRLPAWAGGDVGVEDFNRPTTPLRPPTDSEVITSPFPADGAEEPPEFAPGPLEVLRVQPEGDVDIAPSVSITFNQPMVPLTTLDQLELLDVPVTLTPTVEGRWEWIGTRTLRFEAEVDGVDRLPMATSYQVEVPAATVSDSGSALMEPYEFEFETPTPTVRSFTAETESLSLDPVFVAIFDQRVDPVAVLEVATLTVDGEEMSLRVATAAEIEADEEAQRMVDRAVDGRFVAFRPASSLAAAAEVRVEVGPEIPSVEGPNTNDVTFAWNGRTYAPLRITDQNCDERVCEPGEWFWLHFNNPLDLESFDPSMVTVDPAIPGLAVTADFDSVQIRGVAAGRTDYEVTVDRSLQDVFGQRLGKDETRTFEVGPARPTLQGLNQELITLDPFVADPTLRVLTVNHESVRLRAFAVEPADWNDYLAYQNTRWDDEVPSPPWGEVYAEEIDIDSDEDTYTTTELPIGDITGGESGHFVLVVEPTGDLADMDRDDELYWGNRPLVVWVQATQLGIDVLSDHDAAVVWVTEATTGEPVEGVSVRLDNAGSAAVTDDQGLTTLDFRAGGHAFVVAESDNDSAILAQRGWWYSYDIDIGDRWYVIDDRGIYRPGETVSVKGWIRSISGGDLQIPTLSSTGYVAYDNFGAEIGSGDAEVNSLGGFDLALDIPLDANVGWAWIEFDGGFGHSFQIQEFRRPEFEVTARVESNPPFFVDEPATVAVDAEYFAGGGLAGAPVEWLVSTSPTNYTPPNWDDFSFGQWEPYWYELGSVRGFVDEGFAASDADFSPWSQEEREHESFTGVTNAAGTHYLRMDFDGDGEGRPTSVSAQATVFDVNRQAWSASTDVLVHPADVYVGLRSATGFVRAGEPLDIEVIAVDIDGLAMAGRPVEVTAARLEWQFQAGEWHEVDADTQTCDVASAEAAVRCSFTTELGGQYLIAATVTDERGRFSRAEMRRWVSGGDRLPSRTVDLEEVTLVPDAGPYAPGDTAEILVEAPFAATHGLVTISQNGIVSNRTITLDSGTAIVEIPITEDHVPNVFVQVDVAGATQRTDDRGNPIDDVVDRPAFASGSINLSVPAVTRTLSVDVTPAATVVEPGDTTELSIEVVDASGSAVAGAEVAVIVVDEAVLALSDYELEDPVSNFYPEAGSNLQAAYGRSLIELTDPAALLDSPSDADLAAGEDGEEAMDDDAATSDEADALAPVAAGQNGRSYASLADTDVIVRSNFDALAVFSPEERTDVDGSVTVTLPLPDSLTRYRVMAVAVDGADHFGTGESSITARLPLMVRPSAPRLLNFGDAFELPVVLQNQTADTLIAEVAIEAANLELPGVTGKRVRIPANDRVEVRFDATTDAAGTAAFRVVASAGDFADAAEGSLPVYTPATSEAFATYGVLDEGSTVQSLGTPVDVFPQFGGLEVNTASTAVQALTDTVLYLAEYRYESADAFASRIMAVASVREIIEAFAAEGIPTPSEFDEVMASDIDRLQQLQNFDGGFGYWRRFSDSNPYVSIQATHALLIARDEGYGVSAEHLNNALSYLRQIESSYPGDYSQRTKDALTAYALHVRGLADDRDTTRAQQLFDDADLELDGIARIWPLLSGDRYTEAERIFANQATETAGAATFATDYGEDAYLLLHSDRRTDGIVLDALVSETPSSDLIPKVVAGLLGNQRNGRWNNVQENTFILIAMNNYFATFEGVTPDFVARVWLGDLYAAEHTFVGRTTEQLETIIPMQDVIAEGAGGLVLKKNGDGRLYYRLGLRYAPTDLDLEPRDRGFVVQRTYEAIDDPGDVRQLDDGSWAIRAGAQVRVQLSLVADSRRTNMALVDALPAGLEALNPALAVTGEVLLDDDDSASASRYWWRWYDHEALRDDRVEVFSAYLPAGTYEYSYVARATTPGEFIVPPARAEEIYAPETFGRSATERVVIE